jgi:osmotically-inducible protein OsmY
MNFDNEIQTAIEAELRARPDSHVSATVHQGVVRLSGFTRSYCEKYLVEQAVRGIAGVTEVINEIETQVTPSAHPSDANLRCEVVRALQTEVPSIFERLGIEVRDGAVTLSGVVGCHFLRERAESAVRRLGHIATVHNTIEVEAESLVREVQELLEGSGIRATASHGEVTLSGSVASAEARTHAEQAAWSVPCVMNVINELVVRPER